MTLSDSSSCSEWGSASQAQQHAYSRLYFNEHVGLLTGAGDAADIESAITKACTRAAYLAEADEVTVVGALKHQY